MRVNIAKHIFDFLIQNKKVCIPDIGTFSLNHIPANFGEGRKSLLPPSKEIVFSKEENDDFRVHKYLATQEQIPKKKAKQLVSIFSDKVNAALAQYGKADIGYLGSLKQDGLGLEFEQSYDATKSFSLGLPEVSLPDLVDIRTDKIVNTETKPITLHEKLAHGAKEAEKTSTQTNLQEPPAKQKRGLGSILFLLVGLLLLAALFSFLFKHFQSENAMFKSNTVPAAVDNNSTQNQDSKTIDSLSTNGATAAIDPAIGDNECVIIIGVFEERQRAEKLIGSLTKAGYKLYDKEYGDYFRIGIQFECDRNDDKRLRSLLKKVRNSHNGNAWYLVPEFYVK